MHKKARALTNKGDFNRAYRIYRNICNSDPSDSEALSSLAYICGQTENYQEAEDCYRKVLEIRPGDAITYYNLAIACRTQGKLADSILHYRKAIELNPGFVEAIANLAMALLDQGDYDHATEYLQEAIQYTPTNSQLYLNLGIAYFANRSLDKAESCLQTAIRINPDYVDAIATLGHILEKQHKMDKAGEMAKRALALDPDHAQGNILMARLESRSDRLIEACERLEGLRDGNLTPQDLSDLHHELAQIHDCLGNYRDAYRFFQESKRQAATISETRFNKKKLLERLEYYKAWFTPANVSHWTTDFTLEGSSNPVFLVGFPRSGTTLTEQILSSHSSVISTDELPIVSDTLKNLMELPACTAGYPVCLSQLEKRDIEALRKTYWDQALASLKETKGSRLLIDKLPLNIVHVGFLHRIFPDAQFIVVIRDPRDSCLSCFMQKFQLNEYMAHFTSFEETTRLYDAVMSLWIHYRNTLDIRYLEIRYEDLVNDTEHSARGALEFLGLPWEDKVLHYYSQERHNKYISTPSYIGVSSPIYNSAIGRWNNYEAEIGLQIEPLLKYLETFGYSTGR